MSITNRNDRILGCRGLASAARAEDRSAAVHPLHAESAIRVECWWSSAAHHSNGRRAEGPDGASTIQVCCLLMGMVAVFVFQNQLEDSTSPAIPSGTGDALAHTKGTFDLHPLD